MTLAWPPPVLIPFLKRYKDIQERGVLQYCPNLIVITYHEPMAGLPHKQS